MKAPGEGTGPRTSQRPGKDSRCPNKSASCMRAVQNQGSVKGGSWTTSDGGDDLDWFEVRPNMRACAALAILVPSAVTESLQW